MAYCLLTQVVKWFHLNKIKLSIERNHMCIVSFVASVDDYDTNKGFIRGSYLATTRLLHDISAPFLGIIYLLMSFRIDLFS